MTITRRMRKTPRRHSTYTLVQFTINERTRQLKKEASKAQTIVVVDEHKVEVVKALEEDGCAAKSSGVNSVGNGEGRCKMATDLINEGILAALMSMGGITQEKAVDAPEACNWDLCDAITFVFDQASELRTPATRPKRVSTPVMPPDCVQKTKHMLANTPPKKNIQHH